MRINYLYIILLILACLLAVAQYSVAVLTLDAEKIWGNRDTTEGGDGEAPA